VGTLSEPVTCHSGLAPAEKTVKNYVSSILSKLEVARRAEAAAYLARHTTTAGTQG